MIYKIVILAFGFIVALLLYTEFVRVEPQPITHDKNKSYKDQVQDEFMTRCWKGTSTEPYCLCIYEYLKENYDAQSYDALQLAEGMNVCYYREINNGGH